MVDILFLLIALSLFFISGGSVLFFLNRLGQNVNLFNIGWLFNLALSYSLGIGIVSLQIFLYSLFHRPLSPLSIFLLWIIIVGCIFFIKRERNQKLNFSVMDILPRNLTWSEKLLIFIILFQVLYCGIYAMSWPLDAWDAWAFWFLKAKAFFLAKGMPPDWFFLTPGKYPHPDYPLLTPLAVTWVYINLGRIDDQMAKIIFVLNAVALLTIFCYTLRQIIKRNYALFFTAILSITPAFIAHAGGFPRYDYVGYADLTLAMYMLAAAAFFHHYLTGRNPPFLILYFIFLGMASWTKNEGLTYALIGSFIAIISVSGKKKFLGLFLMSAFIIPWTLYKIYLSIPGEYIGALEWERIAGNMERIPIIFKGILGMLFNVQLFGLIWPIFMLTSILNWRNVIKTPLLLCILLIFSQLSIYSFIYHITPLDVNYHISHSVDRMVVHLSPLALWIAAMNTYELLTSRFLVKNIDFFVESLSKASNLEESKQK